ncbi:glycosyltransferase 87 family protein [Microbispora hainanensis]|uniref:Glycosyltransferase 87 family protein n=1 Tax=Microbispora hainanensis TaxID=568844 RepID=A0ABZ1SJE3_9ACTN|nr:glycosyltransferase 87 family protein [Microbispora hainanensis]
MTTGRIAGARRPAWAWALALVALAAAASPLIAYWLTNPEDQRLVDLDVYRTGGWALLQGLPVYDVITPAPQLLPFTYPPVAAMLAVPLAMMSWPVAQWVWTIALVTVLAVTVRHAFRAFLDGVRDAAPGGVSGSFLRDSFLGGSFLSGSFLGGSFLGRLRGPLAAPLVFAVLSAACTYLMPIRDQFRFGQVDLFLMALCLLDCVARRPWWPRGMLIGLATAVKLTPGVFLVYLAITAFPAREGDTRQRHGSTAQRRALCMAVFTAALLTLLPFLVMFDDARDFWFGALLDSERLGANAATTNQSLRGMLLRLYLPGRLTTVIWLAAVAVIGWYGFRRARRAHLDGDMMTAVALTGLMAVLLSPVAWIHHIAWVVVVLAALAGSGRDRVRLLVAAGVWLYYVLPIPWWGVTLKALEIPVLSPVVGKIVQNAFGLGAIGLVWLLGSWLPRRRAAVAVPAAAS